MFPQSELDNYKLQVELLQEKLQRSEISRQQLEHKLDKILQKRDEHDKMVQSKARQKYQTFLEEQQRRNERNKQLVQMLESIEQQTEAMNARSERLKMMKLQYEMYFAKLVHSQTRRCIQNSINPMTQMMPTSSPQRIHPTVQQQFMEGYNQATNIETPTSLTHNSYQRCATSYNENESLLRSQPENIPWHTTEMPTLENFVRTEKNDNTDFRNFNAPSTHTQHLYQHQAKCETIPTNNAYNEQDTPDNISYPKVNTNKSSLSSSATNLLPNDKHLAEFKENLNLSTAFGEVPNADNVHNLSEISQPTTTTTVINTYNKVKNKNDAPNISANFQPLQNTQYIKEISLKCANQKDTYSISNLKNVNQNINNSSQDVIKEIKSPSPTVNKVNELKVRDAAMPKLTEKPLTTSLKLEPIKAVIGNSTSSNNTNIVNRQPEPTEQIKNESLVNNTESNSSTTPVSIENIENEIYGELLSPMETEEVQNPENPNVAQKLLENLVTQPENVEIKNNNPSEETIVKQDIILDAYSVKDTTATGNKNEHNLVASNDEETVAYDNYNNDQQPGELANSFANYTDYQNLDNTAIDESQQQQQQYDYSNYDPTQYSYPGYIYDATTGEYKPDPNASAEQYATDQQYSEGYDQPYQQQDYDYNQTYTELPTTSSATAESTAYNNYDAPQQVVSSNFTPPDIDPDQQQHIINPEYTALQPDATPEEASLPSTKVIKPTSILSTADKNDSQKKKKRVNFIDSSETDESAAVEKITATKPTAGNLAGSSESDFDFSSSSEAEPKAI